MPSPSVEERAALIMRTLVVNRGLSYVDAIKECERYMADHAAPYRRVIDQLRAQLTPPGTVRPCPQWSMDHCDCGALADCNRWASHDRAAGE